MKANTVLKHRVKRHFDIDNKADVELFRDYVETSSWGHNGCPFELEFPFLTVPDMIKSQIVHKFLGLPV